MGFMDLWASETGVTEYVGSHLPSLFVLSLCASGRSHKTTGTKTEGTKDVCIIEQVHLMYRHYYILSIYHLMFRERVLSCLSSHNVGRRYHSFLDQCRHHPPCFHS